jgi:hypothetical protein
VAARTNREGERVDSPEESRPMGLTVNENLRANWILEQFEFMKAVDGMARAVAIHPEMKMNMEGKEPKG